MAFRFDYRDVTAFKVLLVLSFMYGLMSALVYSIVHLKFVKPLDSDAPLDRFSEARAIQHVRVLADEIGDRQEGRPGLREAAVYIKTQLEGIKERAGPKFRIEIEENVVNGSFNMIFLGHSISLGYRNHTNIVMRISSTDSQDTDPSVLMNGHFDGPLSSPGAGDCGSCVASMLELARLTVDSGWIPPRPIIFLFNGAEELFMLGAHGFMKAHKWRDSVGAVINVEASGTGGLGMIAFGANFISFNFNDLVCQSGPSSWPSSVYAQSAIYPMAHSAAQDVFPVIPGDTDYRIFSQDYGDIPGLDIIFLIGGYYYHTSHDTVDRLLATVLHGIPIVIFITVPFFLRLLNSGLHSWFATYSDFVKGMMIHATGKMLAIIFPIAFSVLRLLFSGYAMSWFAHPFLAFMMFIPCSLLGLLIPRILWSHFPLSQDAMLLKTSKEALSDEARFWGAFGFYAMLTMAYLVAGLTGGFLTFIVATSMLPAWIFFCISINFYGRRSLRSTLFYVVPLIPCITYSVYFGGFVVQFLIEKMGMMGAFPSPYGYYIQDIVVAAAVGAVTGWCVGPLLPICGLWLARSSVLQFLLHLTVLALALSSQFFPYSTGAHKRLVFQHTFVTADANQIVESSFDFSVVDSNSFLFLFKFAPEVAKELHIGPEFSLEAANVSQRETWMVLFPVSFLFSKSLKFPATSDEISKQYEYFPYLSTSKPHTTSGDGSRRVYLELSLGSLEEVWVAVLNITGPLSNWSFADNKVPVPEIVDGGPPSYICRLSGSSHENWTFWLEASSPENLRVEVAVLDQVLVDEAKKLKGLFPDWTDVTAYSSFRSSYTF
ncbi:peptidase M28 domain-containing protein [Citrus sinensis]|nr:peptidase M28 domain-containing protein [Citrus sinensis]